MNCGILEYGIPIDIIIKDIKTEQRSKHWFINKKIFSKYLKKYVKKCLIYMVNSVDKDLKVDSWKKNEIIEMISSLIYGNNMIKNANV